MYKTYAKLIVFAIILTFTISFFSAISIALNVGDQGVILSQIGAFALSAVGLFFYIKRKSITRMELGFKKGRVERTLSLFMGVIVLIQPAILGLDWTIAFSTVLLIAIQMILVGFVEEVLFRGIFYYYLKEKKTSTYILFSSIVFGILHIASGLNPETAAMLVVLQIINALLLGVVFALIYLRTKSIYVTILFHGLFNLLASITPVSSLNKNILAVSFLLIAYSIFILFSYKQRKTNALASDIQRSI
ncbi:hypothetical protein IGI37_003762 [Enterococcus sp. AZ194]|uniref:CPBP family intramembrane glutamic endopeptidase n=1 Tax=Enterococcus sp. AZ194 TaxID=2774629 RepID=UPI003F293F77